MILAFDHPRRLRTFRLLVSTQFLTVYNDTAFKQVVLLLALEASSGGADLQAWAGAVFAIPFLMFAMFAGDLSDRISKRDIVLGTKWAEVGVMALATAALALNSLWLSVTALFLMGLQSAFLGPSKYGIVPELMPGRRLAPANALLQSTVLAGILIGTGSSGFLSELKKGDRWMTGALFTIVAFAGTFVAARMERVPAADPGRRLRLNPVPRFREGIALARTIPGLPRSIFAHGVFWLIGGVVLFAWNEMGSSLLFPENWEQRKGIWTFALAGLTVSAAIGYAIAGRLCRDRLPARLVAIGAAGMTAGFLAVGLGPRDPYYVFGVLFATNLFAGCWLIPAKTLVQYLPAPADKGQTLGASQMVDWIFITLASVLKAGVSELGVDAVETFLVLAALLGACVPVFARLPAIEHMEDQEV